MPVVDRVFVDSNAIHLSQVPVHASPGVRVTLRAFPCPKAERERAGGF